VTASEVDEQGVELDRRLVRLRLAALALRDAQLVAAEASRTLEQALTEERVAFRRVDELLHLIRGES